MGLISVALSTPPWSIFDPLWHIIRTLGGHSTLSYVPCATKKTLLFSLVFTERPPFLPTFTQWPPIFNKLKLLATERPWHIFVTQRPLIFAFNSQTSDNFLPKIGFFENFCKFDEMLRNFWPIFWYISLKDPLFLCTSLLCHWKTPIFWHNLSLKDPYIWGAWWH